MVFKQILRSEIKGILEGLGDLPANMLLLLLATIKALLQDTQFQLILILSALFIPLLGTYKSLLVFVATYTGCYFVINNLKAFLLSNHNRPNNE